MTTKPTDAEMLAAALDYAREGLPVFPLQHDKTPFPGSNGFKDATTNLDTIKKMWEQHPGANIGLAAGEAGYMILDYDTHHGEDVAGLRRTVEDNIGEVIPTTLMVVATPRGGEHHFYDLHPGEVCPSSGSKLAPHVDVRSKGGYTLLMMRFAGTKRVRSEDWDKWLTPVDVPQNITTAIQYLEGKIPLAGGYCQPSIQGQGGESMVLKTAGMRRSLALSEQTATTLMWEHYEPRSEPTWAGEPEMFNERIERGYKYATSNPGNLTPEYQQLKNANKFGPLGEAIYTDMGDGGVEVTRNGFRFTDRLAMNDIPPPTWLIQDLFQEQTYNMLAGVYGTYKTFLALDMALTIASGLSFPWITTDWPGMWTANRQAPVLFAASEGRASLTARVAAWEAVYNQGRPVTNFVLADPVPKAAGGVELFIEGALDKRLHEDYGLVVIDTVGRAMAGENENTQEAASKFTEMVGALQRGLNAAVLAIHHEGKESAGPRGSSVFPSDADTLILTRKAQQAQQVLLHMDKQKDAPEWRKDRQVALVNHDATLVAQPGHGVVLRRPTDDKPDTKKQTADKAREVAEAIEDIISTTARTGTKQIPWGEMLARVEAWRDGELGIKASTVRDHARRIRFNPEDYPIGVYYQEGTLGNGRGAWLCRQEEWD
jgi:hypothetical protein